MQDRGSVLDFTVFTDGSRLSVTFDCRFGDTKGGDGSLGKKFAQFFTDGYQLGQVLRVFARKGIFNDGDGRHAPRGWSNASAHLFTCFFEERCQLANARFHRKSVSHTNIFLSSRLRALAVRYFSVTFGTHPFDW